MLTILLEAGDSIETLAAKFKAAWLDRGKLSSSIFILAQPGQKTALEERFRGANIVELRSGRSDVLGLLHTPWVAYLPAAIPYSTPVLPPASSNLSLSPWFPILSLPDQGGMHLETPIAAWIGSSELLKIEKLSERIPAFRDFEALSSPILYYSASADPSLFHRPAPTRKDRRVLALVPYYNCRPWLEACLRSLTTQSRPLQDILVLDDASDDSPLDIIQKFTGVTLWRAKENSGPYRLVQTAIGRTDHEAYLFQDADDWSSQDRLECLLAEMDRSGADAVSSQEVMYMEKSAFPNTYPLEVNASLSKSAAYSFLHPGSLVKRELLTGLGGYASGLRFSGDFEFQLRARYKGKLVNSDRFCYFRRIRPNSLITSETTGMASPARRELDARIRARDTQNRALTAQGQPPVLEPLATTTPVEFEHLAGPEIKKA